MNKAGEPAALDAALLDARLHWLFCSLGMAERPIQGVFYLLDGAFMGRDFISLDFAALHPDHAIKTLRLCTNK